MSLLSTIFVCAWLFTMVDAGVCVAVYGMSRSANYTHRSFDKYLLEPLRRHGIDYSVYFHTWLPANLSYNNFWAGEVGVNLSLTDYLFIPANVVRADVEPPLDIAPYAIHGDPWARHLRGKESTELQHVLYSLMSSLHVSSMWKDNPKCKTLIYTRPDLLFLDELDVNWLNTTDVLTPNFSAWPINDRFAIGPSEKMVAYGERFLLAKQYAQNNSMHTETFLAHIFTLNQWDVKKRIDFCFFRCRANGLVVPEPGPSCTKYVLKHNGAVAWVPAPLRPLKYQNL